MESLPRARLGALAMDDGMCTRQAAADCFRAIGVDVRPAQGAPWPVEEHCDRGIAGLYPVAAVGGRSLSGCSGVACPRGTRLSSRAVLSVVETRFHVGASILFSAGDMGGSPR